MILTEARRKNAKKIGEINFRSMVNGYKRRHGKKEVKINQDEINKATAIYFKAGGQVSDFSVSEANTTGGMVETDSFLIGD